MVCQGPSYDKPQYTHPETPGSKRRRKVRGPFPYPLTAAGRKVQIGSGITELPQCTATSVLGSNQR